MAFLNWCYQAKARFEVDQPLLTEVPRKSTFRQLRNPDVWMGQVAGNTVFRESPYQFREAEISVLIRT
jgi:hypothetical protein